MTGAGLDAATEKCFREVKDILGVMPPVALPSRVSSAVAVAEARVPSGPRHPESAPQRLHPRASGLVDRDPGEVGVDAPIALLVGDGDGERIAPPALVPQVLG